MLLTETGYVPTKDQRLRVFLTNSLEEPHPDSGTLWGNLLSDEADQANEIKRDTPVMCVIGNPPYSGISSNNGKWISDLIDDYKYVDGIHINERKHWLNDDYVKFLRYGQHYIEKNGQGVLAFINPHGFLDNPTFRGMRWHLLKTYDKIFTIDLHGNSNKKEKALDGSPDINVFDIQQGVSITIFIKTGKKKLNELGRVFHFEIFGKREYKYDFLNDSSISSILFTELKPEKPNLFFVPKNDLGIKEYENGIKINELFLINNVGFVSANDELNLSMTQTEQKEKINDIILMDESSWRIKYNRPKDAQSWKYLWAKNDAENNLEKNLTSVYYRPFDSRFTLYTGKSGGLFARPSFQIMKHFVIGKNYGLVIPKINKEDNCFFISNKIISHKLCSAYDSNSIFPLYLYPENKEQQAIDHSSERTPNLNADIIKQISGKIGLTYTNEKETTKDTFAPIDVLDYIYAVLHSPTYREKYKEFLKIDFPRVPYPKDKDIFWKLVKLGGEIRQIHLLESAVVDKPICKFNISGTDVVTKPKYENGNVYINENQCFEDVPEVAWNFYIGGYQPAQKWLKDRKDRELQIEDIRHYMKIIVALTETDRLMKEIEKIEIE
jgi:predicted helicase